MEKEKKSECTFILWICPYKYAHSGCKSCLSMCSLQKEIWNFCLPVSTSELFALVASLQSCSCQFVFICCRCLFFAPGAKSGAEASLLQPVVVRGAGPDGRQQRCHRAAAAASEPQPHPLLLCQLATIPARAHHHQVLRSACSASL